MDKLNEVKQAVQTLYQVARQAPVSAEVHERTLDGAKTVMGYLDEQQPEYVHPIAKDNANNRATKPEVIMPETRGKRKKETIAA